ncbi:MAG: PAS domain-containing protein [Methanospirillum sp.]
MPSEPSPPPSPSSIDAIPEPAFLYGPNRRIIRANGPAEALAGRGLTGAYAANVVGIFRIRRPDCSRVVLAEMPAIRALAGEEVADYPIVVTAADGRRMVVLVSSSPVREGGKVAGALSIWHRGPAQDPL